MTGMEHATERAERVLAPHFRNVALGGVEDDTHLGALVLRAVDALSDAGLLAPAPLREEWGRAYRQADGVLFVDDQDGSFRDRDDVAQFVPPQHPDSPYDLIVKRGVSDWFPADSVNRAEGDGRADQ